MNRETLAREVRDVLDLNTPYQSNIRSGKAAKIVSAVIEAITRGLLRGEKVKISGFGVFSVRTKPQTRRTCGYFYGNKNKKNPPQILRVIPAKKYVFFSPSKLITRELNGNQTST